MRFVRKDGVVDSAGQDFRVRQIENGCEENI